jgi:hypothetical protein
MVRIRFPPAESLRNIQFLRRRLRPTALSIGARAPSKNRLDGRLPRRLFTAHADSGHQPPLEKPRDSKLHIRHGAS